MTRLLLRTLIVPVLVLAACSHSSKTGEAPAPAVRPEFAEAPAFQDWYADCASGKAEACKRLLSSVIYAGRGDLLTGGAEAFAKGCEAGVADGCTGHLLASLNADEPTKTLPGLRKACSDGSHIACVLEVPVSFEETESGEEMFELIELTTLRCEESGGPTCSIIGNVYEQGAGVPQDAQRANALYARGCESRDPASCFQHGQALLAKVPVQEPAPKAEAPTDGAADASGDATGAPATTSTEISIHTETLKSARTAFASACDELMAPACFALAQLHYEGRGGNADPARARSTMWRACDLGDRMACDYLAGSDEGKTWPRPEATEAYKTPEAYAAMQRKYCAFGSGEACTGIAFFEGRAAEADKDFAAMDGVMENLQRGCEAGVGQACAMLSKVAGDAIQGCEGGTEPGQCLVAGFAFTRGTLVPQDLGESLDQNPEAASAAFKKACEGGVQAACAQVSTP